MSLSAIPAFIDYPAMTPENAILTLIEGQNLSLTCRANGYPIPVIRWKHRGNLVGYSSDSRISNSSENGYGVLNITSLQVNDSGSWICVAENSLDYVHAPRETIVHVQREP